MACTILDNGTWTITSFRCLSSNEDRQSIYDLSLHHYRHRLYSLAGCDEDDEVQDQKPRPKYRCPACHLEFETELELHTHYKIHLDDAIVMNQ